VITINSLFHIITYSVYAESSRAK